MKLSLVAVALLTLVMSDAFAQRRPGPNRPRRPGPHRPIPVPVPQPRMQACFFEHDNFGGRSFCVAPGQAVYNLADYGFNDSISSARIPWGMSVVVYEDAYFRGQGIELSGDVYSISMYGRFWNDRVSAIQVYR
jgi:hypothetical protein